jgi:hypothetical protein
VAASMKWYANAKAQAFAKNISLTSDTLKMALMTSSYTPDYGTNAHWSDINGFEITGTGYTAGGVTLTSPAVAAADANSWATSWAGTTSYLQGNIIKPATPNGFIYMAAVAGTSGGSAPTFPTVIGEDVTDGGVTWVCLGVSYFTFTTATAQWTGATFSTLFAVIYDAQTGVSTTEPLICCQQFPAVQSPAAITFQVAPDPQTGVWLLDAM